MATRTTLRRRNSAQKLRIGQLYRVTDGYQNLRQAPSERHVADLLAGRAIRRFNLNPDRIDFT
jgi:hypothetical protein